MRVNLCFLPAVLLNTLNHLIAAFNVIDLQSKQNYGSLLENK